MKTAIYAGSFDMPTLGHEAMISRALLQCDKLIVAIGTNPNKQPMFTCDERIDMLFHALKTPNETNRIVLDHFDHQYLVDYARAKGATVIIRGVRNVEDIPFEQKLFYFNRKRAPEIETVMLFSEKHLTEVSSSFVKSLIGPDDWIETIRSYVSPSVHEAILEKHS